MLQWMGQHHKRNLEYALVTIYNDHSMPPERDVLTSGKTSIYKAAVCHHTLQSCAGFRQASGRYAFQYDISCGQCQPSGHPLLVTQAWGSTDGSVGELPEVGAHEGCQDQRVWLIIKRSLIVSAWMRGTSSAVHLRCRSSDDGFPSW